MIVVTGGAGFIGSNLVNGLNRRRQTDILIVDNLRNGNKFANLRNLQIADYWDKDDFIEHIKKDGDFGAPVAAVFHQGACSTTTEWDGRYMMRNNFTFSKDLLHYCQARQIPFFYASSASVYGLSRICREQARYENPLNVYGYSKLVFDQYVRNFLPNSNSQIVGLRYFNVYGPGEQHKQEMASVVYHLRKQLLDSGKVRLFGAYDDFAEGEQRRDFVYIDDVVEANLWLLEHPRCAGIFNLGTGVSRSFNDLAHAVLGYYGRGELEYIPFPDHLKERYQGYTQANTDALRETGYKAQLTSLEQGIVAYLDILEASADQPAFSSS